MASITSVTHTHTHLKQVICLITISLSIGLFWWNGLSQLCLCHSVRTHNPCNPCPVLTPSSRRCSASPSSLGVHLWTQLLLQNVEVASPRLVAQCSFAWQNQKRAHSAPHSQGHCDLVCWRQRRKRAEASLCAQRAAWEDADLTGRSVLHLSWPAAAVPLAGYRKSAVWPTDCSFLQEGPCPESSPLMADWSCFPHSWESDQVSRFAWHSQTTGWGPENLQAWNGVWKKDK